MKWWLLSGLLLLVVGVVSIGVQHSCADSESRQAAWYSAVIVDLASTQANSALLAEFEATATDEDAEDLRLLHLLKTLDAADDSLPADFGRVQFARTSSERSTLALQVLAKVDRVDADYMAVIGAVRARGSHFPVAQALAPVPSALARLRADLMARVRN